MAKRSIASKRKIKQTIKSLEIEIGLILADNKILLSDLPSVNPNLTSEDILNAENNKKYAIDTTEFLNDNDKVTKKTFASSFIPDENASFSPGSNNKTHADDPHEPKQSFIADSAARYFKLQESPETHQGSDKLRFLARQDEYCDDRFLARQDEYCDDRPIFDQTTQDTIFNVTCDRPNVNKQEESFDITAANVTDNILLTFEDLKNKNLKSTTGLPNASDIKLYNHETAANVHTLVNNPTLDMFVNNNQTTYSEGIHFKQFETTTTFYFKTNERVTNELIVNTSNAGMFSLIGVLAVKPKPKFIEALKTVTMYIEVFHGKNINNKQDSDWIVAESKVVPVYEYGNFVTLSAFLCKNSLVRLRTNLNATMGSINTFQLRNYGSFTNHFSNTFYGFSGVIA